MCFRRSLSRSLPARISRLHAAASEDIYLSALAAIREQNFRIRTLTHRYRPGMLGKPPLPAHALPEARRDCFEQDPSRATWSGAAPTSPTRHSPTFPFPRSLRAGGSTHPRTSPRSSAAPTASRRVSGGRGPSRHSDEDTSRCRCCRPRVPLIGSDDLSRKSSP